MTENYDESTLISLMNIVNYIKHARDFNTVYLERRGWYKKAEEIFKKLYPESSLTPKKTKTILKLKQISTKKGQEKHGFPAIIKNEEYVEMKGYAGIWVLILDYVTSDIEVYISRYILKKFLSNNIIKEGAQVVELDMNDPGIDIDKEAWREVSKRKKFLILKQGNVVNIYDNLTEKFIVNLLNNKFSESVSKIYKNLQENTDTSLTMAHDINSLITETKIDELSGISCNQLLVSLERDIMNFQVTKRIMEPIRNELVEIKSKLETLARNRAVTLNSFVVFDTLFRNGELSDKLGSVVDIAHDKSENNEEKQQIAQKQAADMLYLSNLYINRKRSEQAAVLKSRIAQEISLEHKINECLKRTVCEMQIEEILKKRTPTNLKAYIREHINTVSLRDKLFDEYKNLEKTYRFTLLNIEEGTNIPKDPQFIKKAYSIKISFKFEESEYINTKDWPSIINDINKDSERTQENFKYGNISAEDVAKNFMKQMRTLEEYIEELDSLVYHKELCLRYLEELLRKQNLINETKNRLMAWRWCTNPLRTIGGEHFFFSNNIDRKPSKERIDYVCDKIWGTRESGSKEKIEDGFLNTTDIPIPDYGFMNPLEFDNL